MLSGGKIRLYLGSMYAGKSSMMLRDIRRYQLAKKHCLVVKYAEDTRYDHLATAGGIVTHDKVEHTGFDVMVVSRLSEIPIETIREYDVIGVDEGQFYEDVVLVDTWENAGKIVIVSALDGTYQKKPFGGIPELIPLCEEFHKYSAVCDCGNDAAFTKRIGPGDAVKDIGSFGKYKAVCRNCFYKV